MRLLGLNLRMIPDPGDIAQAFNDYYINKPITLYDNENKNNNKIKNGEWMSIYDKNERLISVNIEGNKGISKVGEVEKKDGNKFFFKV